MALSRREERIIWRLEQQFRQDLPYFERRRRPALVAAAAGAGTGFVVALTLLVSVVIALAGFVVFLLACAVLLASVDWRTRLRQARSAFDQG